LVCAAASPVWLDTPHSHSSTHGSSRLRMPQPCAGQRTRGGSTLRLLVH
jgi:hypothetical protein